MYLSELQKHWHQNSLVTEERKRIALLNSVLNKERVKAVLESNGGHIKY